MKINIFEHKPSNVIIWGELLIILTMTLIMIVVVIILFSGNFYNQLKSILLLEKSLGASHNQIFKQILYAMIFFIVI